VLSTIRDFFKRDHGQDLAEYCLLVALLALITAGILFHVSGGMQNLWGGANTTIQTANTAGSGGTQQTGAPSNPTPSRDGGHGGDGGTNTGDGGH